MKTVLNFLGNEDGAVAAEYALILSLNAVLVISSLVNLGSGISNTFGSIASRLPAS